MYYDGVDDIRNKKKIFAVHTEILQIYERANSTLDVIQLVGIKSIECLFV